MSTPTMALQAHGVFPLRKPTRRARALPDDQANRVLAFVEENLADDLSLTTLASVARLSTSYFCRAFKSAFGITVQQHVAKRRLEYAKHLLCTTTFSLVIIAYECGFSDQAHLCNNFRKAMGMSPGQWRRCEPCTRAVERCGTVAAA